MYSVARLCPDQSFLSLHHRCRLAGLSILYKVNANSNRCLFSELPSTSTRVRHPGLRPQLIHWNLKCQRVEPPNFKRRFMPAHVQMWNDLPYTVLGTERWMSSREQSTVGCFPELCFLQFSVVQVLVGLRKQFINNFVFSTWACAAGFHNNNTISKTFIVSS